MNRACPTCRRRLDAYGFCAACARAKWSARAAAVERVPASREVMGEHVRRILARAAGGTLVVTDAQRLALHEGGHAVLAWQMGRPLRSAHIDLAAARGEVRYEPGEDVTVEAALTVAGAVAERRYAGGEIHGCRDDQAQTMRLVERGANIQTAVAIAEDVIDRHTADVRRVAAALVERRELDAADLATLLPVGRPARVESAPPTGSRIISGAAEVRAFRLERARKHYAANGWAWTAQTESEVRAHLDAEYGITRGVDHGVIREFPWAPTLRPRG